MNALGKIILTSLIGLGTREAILQNIEHTERSRVFHQARLYADSVGKPLLVVGVPKSAFLYHPCGDVNIDIDPNICTPCEYQIADIKAIPYPDRYFGAAYASHVLEHLATVDDAKQALHELHRVADKVFIVSPHKSSLTAWLHPRHYLWVSATGDGVLLEQRGYRPEISSPIWVGMVTKPFWVGMLCRKETSCPCYPTALS